MNEQYLQEQITNLQTQIAELSGRLESIENKNAMMSNIFNRVLPAFPPQGKRHGHILYFNGDVVTWIRADEIE